MNKIAVIGAGTMGNGIAHSFAMNGFQVNLIDVSEEALRKGMAMIEKNMSRMVSKEKMTSLQKSEALANINLINSLKEGVQDVDLVIEAATENLELKLNIFEQLDQYTPSNAILASNTSSISITQIASATQNPERVIGMHFMNPVPLMKLVEVISGYNTSDSVRNEIKIYCESLSKIPIEVNDYPGFVANRILMPMINEAIETLYNGVAGVSEIDDVMRLGMAHPMGPLQLADFIGLDICLSILEVMYSGFKNPKYAPCPLLINMVRAKKLGIKSGEGFYDYTESRKAEKVSDYFSNH